MIVLETKWYGSKPLESWQGPDARMERGIAEARNGAERMQVVCRLGADQVDAVVVLWGPEAKVPIDPPGDVTILHGSELVNHVAARGVLLTQAQVADAVEKVQKRGSQRHADELGGRFIESGLAGIATDLWSGTVAALATIVAWGLAGRVHFVGSVVPSGRSPSSPKCSPRRGPSCARLV